MLQPDLGTALAIGFGGVGGDVPRRPAAALVRRRRRWPRRWSRRSPTSSLLHDYQRNRVTTFLDPESDPLGTGYHITQSKIAIGSGGLTGKGFGEGSQSHLNYLPEPHTDFVFATMAEEWGLIGGLFVLLVFGIVLRWGLSVARRAPDRFSQPARRRDDRDDLLLRRDQPDDGHGPRPGGRHPAAVHEPRRLSMMTNMICIGTLMMVDRWSRAARGGGGLALDGPAPFAARGPIAIWARSPRFAGSARNAGTDA